MHLLKHRSLVFYLGFILILALAIGGSVAAFADSGTGATVAISGGALTEDGPTTVSATPVTLNGTDQTTSYDLGLTVSDPRGTGAGWNLTITSTTFTSGTDLLSDTASTINAVPTVVCATGTCTAPLNSVSYASPLGVPAGSPTAPTPVKFFNAALTTGLGNFTITPTVNIAIPANTIAGSYTSLVSVAIVSGP